MKKMISNYLENLFLIFFTDLTILQARHWHFFILHLYKPAKLKGKKKKGSTKDMSRDFQIPASVLFLQSYICLAEGLTMVSCFLSKSNSVDWLVWDTTQPTSEELFSFKFLMLNFYILLLQMLAALRNERMLSQSPSPFNTDHEVRPCFYLWTFYFLHFSRLRFQRKTKNL